MRSADAMIFWGATGQAKVLRECMQDTGVSLVALFDRDRAIPSPFPDVPLLYGTDGFEAWVRRQDDPGAIGFLVAIGGLRGDDRVEIQGYLRSFGLTPLIARHRTAFIADTAVVGAGSQVLANSSVCVDAVLGEACIVNTGSVVDHDCRLDDGVHIAPGARLTGSIMVGRGATVGAGAVILPHLKIGEGAVVGAGAVVIRDVPAHTTVVGNPAAPVEVRS